MSCETCADRLIHGRGGLDPIHCRRCHATWTGNEAQHCVLCHTTFVGVHAADAHRYHRQKGSNGKERYVEFCLDPAVTSPWREVRPGVWTHREAVEK